VNRCQVLDESGGRKVAETWGPLTAVSVGKSRAKEHPFSKPLLGIEFPDHLSAERVIEAPCGKHDDA
jgi:hypothetical protein